MINLQVLLIILGVFTTVLLGVIVKKLSKVKVWIDWRSKENQPLMRTCYLEKGEDGTAAEVHMIGAFGKPAIGIVKVDDKSTHNRGFVEVLMTDINDDAEKPNYRRTGYLSFDTDATVDQYGYIYKQIKGKKEKEVIGYLARPSKPNEPTIYGERSWKTLWLRCVLCAYAGQPTPEPAEAPEPATPNQPNQPQQTQQTQQAEHLYIHSPRRKREEDIVPETAEVPELTPDVTPELPEVAPTVIPEVTVDIPQPESPTIPEVTVDVIPEATVEVPEATGIAPVIEETPTLTETETTAPEDAPQPEEATQEPAPQPAPQPVVQLEKPKPRIPLAVCSFWGFHNSKKDLLPAEARAASFALLQRFAPRQRQTEYASEQPYGWKDTALLSALIYSVLFILVYLVNSGIFQMPLLGKDWQSASVFVGYYYVLWAIVRFIKIDAIENANSFQPILDLFNKNLGMKWMNLAILVLCSVAMAFTLFYYDYDFMPLLIVISTGVGINMTMPGANRRWKVQSSFLDDNADSEEEDAEQDEPKNPQGDISRSYEWNLDETYMLHEPTHGSLTLYFKAADIRDIRHLNPFFDQRKDHSDKENILYMFRFLKKYRKTFLARTNYVAHTINRIAEKNGFTPIDKLQFTLDFVQEPNIAFQENAENKTVNFYDDYIRYPDETLYDKCGDSNSKSLLAAMIFHLMGKNVLYLISRKHQHSAIGVEIKLRELKEGWYGDAAKVEEFAVKYEDRYFIFCETTGDKFSLGKQVSGMSLDEFDEKIYLPLHEEDDECDQQDEESKDTVESRIFTWELDSWLGNKLTGNLPLEMSTAEVDGLRAINPFSTYGKDQNSYAQNVQAMFLYLKNNPARLNCTRQVADYVTRTVQDAGYPELDKLQFALDFAQEPNIKYMLDEQSWGIECAKEYMRFPEEVLFDKEGDCDCKSSLTAALFLCMGYKVIFLLSAKLKHAAIGVECRDELWIQQIQTQHPEDVVLMHNGTRYLYCETTGNGFRIGQIKENESIKDFETILELSL